MYYYYVTMADQTIRFERNATEEEYNRLKPHISKISKMLIDKRRIDIVVNAYGKLVEEFDNASLVHQGIEFFIFVTRQAVI